MKYILKLALILCLTSCFTQKKPIYYTYFKSLDSMGYEVIKYRLDGNYKDLVVLLEPRCERWGIYYSIYRISLLRFTNSDPQYAKVFRNSNRFMKVGGKWLPVYIQAIDWPLTSKLAPGKIRLIMPLFGEYLGALNVRNGELER